jgi:hypothetical protein
MIALLLALPLVTCVSLALLPPGRAAAIGIAVAAAVVAAVSRRAGGETGAGIAGSGAGPWRWPPLRRVCAGGR